MSFLKKLSPTHTHPLIPIHEFLKPYNWLFLEFESSPHIHLWIFKTLWVIIFWVWVICKRLNVNWKKIHSIILSVTCHSLRNFPSLIHIPHIHLWIFKTLWLIISWVWVICKMLKVNYTEIQWITLSVTYHLDMTPLYPCMTHPTPTWPTYPCMTHPTSTWPTHPCPYITHPTPTWPTIP